MNKWHQCTIEIHGQKLTLIVDQEPPVVTYELFSTAILWPRSFTFIGNLPIQYRSFDMLSHSFVFDGFHGAIQRVSFSSPPSLPSNSPFQIILNHQPIYDIRQDAIELFNISEHHGYPCHPNPCTLNKYCQQTELNNYTCHTRDNQMNVNEQSSLEFDGRQNLIYSYLPLNLHRNYFKFSFKTKHSHGLIFYLGETTNDVFSQYLSLTIRNGLIQFTAKIAKNTSEISIISKRRVDDGQWHRIELERFVRMI